MELKELILKHRRDFNVSICLTGVIPFLVFVYLLVRRISTFRIFVGEIGYIMFSAVLIFLLGIAVGRKMFMALLNELIEKNRLSAVTETALALSHEINNPLLAIRGNLELVDSAQLPDETKKRFVTVKENFERIREAMDKLVSLSKPASQIIYSNKRMIDLGKSG